MSNTSKSKPLPKQLLRLASTHQEAENLVNIYFANVGRTLDVKILGKQHELQEDFIVVSFFDKLNSFVLLYNDVNEILDQISSLKIDCESNFQQNS